MSNEFNNFSRDISFDVSINKKTRPTPIKTKSEVDSGDSVVNIDNVDYSNTELTCHISGKELIIESGVSVYTLDSGERVEADTTDIVPKYTVIQNTAPVYNTELLMDAGLWPAEKIGVVQYDNQFQFFGVNIGDSDLIRDDRRYTPKVYQTRSRLFSLPIVSNIVNVSGVGRKNLYTAVPYNDYKTYIIRLQETIKEFGYVVDVREFTGDEYVYNFTSSVEESMAAFVSAYQADFSDITQDTITITDISTRDLISSLYSPDDPYDRRNIKSRDVFTSRDVNNNDINAGRISVDDPRPNENYGDFVFQVLTQQEYIDKYQNLYSSVARFIFPVDFGKRKVKIYDSNGNVVYLKKNVGTKPVLVTVINPNALELVSSLEDDQQNIIYESISSNKSEKLIANIKLPTIPSSEYNIKNSFNFLQTLFNDGTNFYFNDESSNTNIYENEVRSKVEFLVKILKYEFGTDRVSVIKTSKSIDSVKSELGNDNTLLSWFQYGYSVSISILDENRLPIQDKSPDFYKLLDIADVYIKLCTAGNIGIPINVIWGAQINTNPDIFVWEFLPIGVKHTDIINYRDKILQNINPKTGDQIVFKDVQDYLTYIESKMYGYGTDLVEIEPDYTISNPIDRFYGEYKYKDVNNNIYVYPVGSYVELENQVDESLNTIWQIKSGKWSVADKYVNWMIKNPNSYNELIHYYTLIGSTQIVDSLNAIKFTSIYNNIDTDLDPSEYIRNFYSMVGYDKMRDIKIYSNDDISSYITISYDSELDQIVFNKILNYRTIGRSFRDVYTINVTIPRNNSRIISNVGEYNNIEVGDSVEINGLDYKITAVLSDYIITVDSVIPDGYTGDITVKPFNGENINGQKTIERSVIRLFSKVGDEYIYPVDDYTVDGLSRYNILLAIKTSIIEHLESIQAIYINSSFNFMYDSIQNSPNVDFQNLLQNEFGIISIQEVIDIDRLRLMYKKVLQSAPTNVPLEDDDDIDRTQQLNIYEETVSVARGVKIVENNENRITQEELADINELRDRLNAIYGNGSKVDSRDF